MSPTPPAGRSSRRWRKPPRPTPTSRWSPTWSRSTWSPGATRVDFSTSGAVHGLYAFNRAIGRVETLPARATILATGGAGRAYLYSTAPRGATGDGIAMAWRAGCRVSNMEFMQFHPTCLYNLEVKNFLITEAVRGEGGMLNNPETGHRFMPDYDERAELAPRDIVARAIDSEIKRDGLDYVHLDISHRDARLRERRTSPTSTRNCSGSASTSPGSRSRSSRRSIILAAGCWSTSTAGPTRRGCMRRAKSASRGCTAPTGWRRTACSNASCSAKRRRGTSSPTSTICPPCPRSARGTKAGSPTATRKSSSSNAGAKSAASCGISSASSAPTKRLERAKHRIDLLRQEVADYYRHFRVTPDLIELRNLVEVADLIVRSALSRHESRGLHFTLDYPELAAEAVDTVLVP